MIEAGRFDVDGSTPTVRHQRFDARSVRCRMFRRGVSTTPYFFFIFLFSFRINMQYAWYNICILYSIYIWSVILISKKYDWFLFIELAIVCMHIWNKYLCVYAWKCSRFFFVCVSQISKKPPPLPLRLIYF